MILSKMNDKSKFLIACVTSFDVNGKCMNNITYVPFIQEAIQARTVKKLELAWKKFILETPTKDCLRRQFAPKGVTVVGYNDGELYNIAAATINASCGQSFKKIFAVRYEEEDSIYSITPTTPALNCVATIETLEKKGLITRQSQSLSHRDIEKIILQLTSTYSTFETFNNAYSEAELILSKK